MKDVVVWIDSLCDSCSWDRLELSAENHMQLSLFQAMEFLGHN